jgi:hypothetical protein
MKKLKIVHYFSLSCTFHNYTNTNQYRTKCTINSPHKISIAQIYKNIHPNYVHKNNTTIARIKIDFSLLIIIFLQIFFCHSVKRYHPIFY